MDPTHLAHPVIKAFNTIQPHQLATRGKPAGAPGRIALPRRETTKQPRPR
jgi:hypothetical protein